MKIYLVRHGQSYVNLEDWEPENQAALDAGLTPLGKKQAQALAAWLPQGIPSIDHIYTSSMRRAQETAALLAPVYGCKVRLDHRIREFGCNRLDHRPFPNESLPETYVYPSRNQLPFTPINPGVANSETYSHFRTRVGLFLEDMIHSHPGKLVLVVCHGGTINAVFDIAFNVGLHRTCNIQNLNTSLTFFEYLPGLENESWHLHFQGKIDHLVGLEQPDQ